MELSRVIPEHTETVVFCWCKRHFTTMDPMYRKIRKAVGDNGPHQCWWCHTKFVDGDKMALASRMKAANVLLCQSCADELLTTKEADRG